VSVALITGASSGLGAEFARALAARGLDLVLVARRRDRLAELAHSLEAHYHVRAEVIEADLATDPGVAAVERHIAELPDLDYLINNAGFGVMGRFWEVDVAAQDKMHRLHVLATVRLTHAALGGMLARNRGGIVNVSSVAGFTQNPGSVSYAATKCWMNSFTEGLYLDLGSARSAVRVQALCPGFTHTEFHLAAGMDKALVPRWLWLDAGFVVAESLNGLERGEWLVIPSRRYRWFARLYGWIPRSVRHALTFHYARRMKRFLPPPKDASDRAH
jgi:uncharacterized protein